MPADLTREEIAAGVRLEGWRWMRGMSIPANDWNRAGLVDYPPDVLYVSDAGTDERTYIDDCDLPDPADPATSGCLLDLLGPAAHLVRFVQGRGWQWFSSGSWHDAPNLGTACFRAALARGRWG